MKKFIALVFVLIILMGSANVFAFKKIDKEIIQIMPASPWRNVYNHWYVAETENARLCIKVTTNNTWKAKEKFLNGGKCVLKGKYSEAGIELFFGKRKTYSCDDNMVPIPLENAEYHYNIKQDSITKIDEEMIFDRDTKHLCQ